MEFSVNESKRVNNFLVWESINKHDINLKCLWLFVFELQQIRKSLHEKLSEYPML